MNCTRMRGKKGTPHRDPADPPRRRANKRKGHGTYANDRPPIISVVSRDTGEHRFWVCDHAAKRTCNALIAENVPAGSTKLYTDEWPGYYGSHPAHATVRHGVHEGSGLFLTDEDRVLDAEFLVSVINEEANAHLVQLGILAEGQGLTNQIGAALPKCVVDALDE